MDLDSQEWRIWKMYKNRLKLQFKVYVVEVTNLIKVTPKN
jgi:hypothetical protein